jgi:hypothetical protein
MDDDDGRYTDDFAPEDDADPSCVECGGQGGWRDPATDEWVWCDCVPGGDDDWEGA